jgi:hypothetical protein
MYPECRYVRPSGGTCNSPALKGSHWCYFHSRIQERLQERKAIRHSQRRADGRFIALPAPQPEGDAIRTVDYGTYPVGPTSTKSHPERSEGSAVLCTTRCHPVRSEGSAVHSATKCHPERSEGPAVHSATKCHPERSEGPAVHSATKYHPERSEGPAVHSTSLDLPPLEDAVSIQLALIDVAQAAAANRIDTKPFSQKMQACKGY